MKRELSPDETKTPVGAKKNMGSSQDSDGAFPCSTRHKIQMTKIQ